jgi:hypothetical protein
LVEYPKKREDQGLADKGFFEKMIGQFWNKKVFRDDLKDTSQYQ